MNVSPVISGCKTKRKCVTDVVRFGSSKSVSALLVDTQKTDYFHSHSFETNSKDVLIFKYMFSLSSTMMFVVVVSSASSHIL